MTQPASTPAQVLGVIPARLASSRLPRKVLREIHGRPLLAWVYDAACACPQFDQVLIAADSSEVAELCHRNRWPCLLTSPELPSGTDRLYAVSLLHSAHIYVNIQGDEPLLQPAHIAALLAPFAHPHVEVTTLRVPCAPADLANPNAVKVVSAIDGRAMYFSRATIPYDRNAATDPSTLSHDPVYKHLGLYAYRRAALERFATLPPSTLEQVERLEQLRLLENNLALYVADAPCDTVGVDTEEDLARVAAQLQPRTP